MLHNLLELLDEQESSATASEPSLPGPDGQEPRSKAGEEQHYMIVLLLSLYAASEELCGLGLFIIGTWYLKSALMGEVTLSTTTTSHAWTETMDCEHGCVRHCHSTSIVADMCVSAVTGKPFLFMLLMVPNPSDASFTDEFLDLSWPITVRGENELAGAADIDPDVLRTLGPHLHQECNPQAHKRCNSHIAPTSKCASSRRQLPDYISSLRRSNLYTGGCGSTLD